MSRDTGPLGGYYQSLLGRVKFMATNGRTIDCGPDDDPDATALRDGTPAILPAVSVEYIRHMRQYSDACERCMREREPSKGQTEYCARCRP